MTYVLDVSFDCAFQYTSEYFVFICDKETNGREAVRFDCAIEILCYQLPEKLSSEFCPLLHTMCLVFEGPSNAVLRAGVSGPVVALGRPVHAAGEQAADGAGQQLGRAGEGRRHGLAAGEP